jgi:phage head maturation protease
LATRGAGTLKISADPNLRVSATLDPARPDVQIIASALRRGEMRQMSIGFMAVKARDKWSQDMSEVVRTEVALREASIVEKGANTGGTDATIRAFDDFMESLTDVDMSEAEIRRAIAHFESLLPEERVEEIVNEFAERDREDRERLERKTLIRPAFAA